MKGSLDELLGKPIRQAPDIPQQGDAPDGPEMLGRCVSLQRRTSLFGIILKKPGRPDKALDYYDVELDITNGHIKMITGARKVWLIEMDGRNLMRLGPLLKERKVEWIAQADRDFGQEEAGEPFISLLEWTDVTERERPRE